SIIKFMRFGFMERGKTMSIRPIKRIEQSTPTLEGAGVKLRRAFGFGTTSEFDPFLLFDDFRNENPADYLAGFPWHPHRGIETITYVLAGSVDHGDSLGNRGSLGAGDVQWMTAGSGILHQEMPKGDPHGRMHGFQLWANLPSPLKMTKPRYQDVSAADIPEIADDDGTRVRVICGDFWGKTGPVEGVAGPASGQLHQIGWPRGKQRQSAQAAGARRRRRGGDPRTASAAPVAGRLRRYRGDRRDSRSGPGPIDPIRLDRSRRDVARHRRHRAVPCVPKSRRECGHGHSDAHRARYRIGQGPRARERR